MKETDQLKQLMESMTQIEEGFPAQARTDSQGSPSSFFSPDNLSTSGLGGHISNAEKVKIDHLNSKKSSLSALLSDDKFSMIALALRNDFKIKDSETVLYGVQDGYKYIQAQNGKGYKLKNNKLFKL